MSAIVVGFDIETMIARAVPRLICSSFAGDQGIIPEPIEELAEIVDFDDTTGKWTAVSSRIPAVRIFQGLLQDPTVILVAHNAAYDTAGFAAASERISEFDRTIGHLNHQRTRPDSTASWVTILDAFEAGRIRCTKVREMLLAIEADRMSYDPILRKKDLGFSLADLVLRYFGVDISEEKKDPTSWRLRYGELDGVDPRNWPDRAKNYSAEDSVWALAAYREQGRELRNGGGGYPLVVPDPLEGGSGVVVDEAPQTAASYSLMLMSAWGIRTDPEKVATFEAETRANVAKGREAATALGFLRADGTKDMKAFQAVVEDAYKALGKDAPRTDPSAKHPNGQVSTAREILEESGNALLIEFAAAGESEKNLSTYVEPAKSAVIVPKHPRFNVLVKTGRTSGDTQQAPRDGGFRECHVARPGYLFVSVDYSQAELRALAQIHYWWFNQSSLRDAMIAGKDLHVDFASDILGISYAEGLERYKAKEPVMKNRRQLAKNANFGAWGGLGPPGFTALAKAQAGVILHPYEKTISEEGIEQPSAKELLGMFREKWVEAPLYFDQIARATANGSFTLVQCQSLRQRGGVGYTDGCNSYFQGLVADFAKAAMWAVTQECHGDMMSPLWGTRPVLFLHDEILAEVPEDKATTASERLCKVMIDAAQPYCPDVPITAAPALMRHWYKEADEVRDERGQLLPWEPKEKT